MNQDRMKNIALVVALILMAVVTLNTFKLKNEIEAMKDQHFTSYNNLQSLVYSLSNEVSSSVKRVEELLEKEQSLFSWTNVGVELQDGGIMVVLEALPRQIAEGEKLYAGVMAGGRTIFEEADDNNRAVVVIDFTDKITPVFKIVSENGIRQEAADEMFISNYFDVSLLCEWGIREAGHWGIERPDSAEYDQTLYAWLLADEKGLPFDPAECEAEFLVLSTGNAGDDPDLAGESLPIEEEIYYKGIDYLFENSERVAVKKEDGSDKIPAGFSADFSALYERQDGMQYMIFFTLLTPDGLRYVTPYDPIASFSSTKEGNRGMTSGSSVLRPDFALH